MHSWRPGPSKTRRAERGGPRRSRNRFGPQRARGGHHARARRSVGDGVRERGHAGRRLSFRRADRTGVRARRVCDDPCPRCELAVLSNHAVARLRARMVPSRHRACPCARRRPCGDRHPSDRRNTYGARRGSRPLSAAPRASGAQLRFVDRQRARSGTASSASPDRVGALRPACAFERGARRWMAGPGRGRVVRRVRGARDTSARAAAHVELRSDVAGVGPRAGLAGGTRWLAGDHRRDGRLSAPPRWRGRVQPSRSYPRRSAGISSRSC